MIVIVINNHDGIEDLTADNEDCYRESSYVERRQYLSGSRSTILGGLLSAATHGSTAV